MIITCPSCLKKFKIEDVLIPSKGRNLQCGSCNHNWFYKVETKTIEPLKLEKNIDEKVIEPNENNISNYDNTVSLKAKLDQVLDKDIKEDNVIQNSGLPKKIGRASCRERV